MHPLAACRVPGRAFAIRVCMGAAGLAYKNTFMTFPELLAARGSTGASDDIPLGQVGGSEGWRCGRPVSLV